LEGGREVDGAGASCGLATKKAEEGERREEAATVENASEQKRREERHKAGKNSSVDP
jgi:hypothetical protein